MYTRTGVWVRSMAASVTFSIWSIFGYNAYFLQHPASKWIYFPIFEHYNISKDANLWRPLASLLEGGEVDICAHWLFCTEFNGQQLLFVAFLDIMRVLSSVQPQSKSTSPFLNITIFQKMAIFGAPLLTLGADTHMHTLTFLYGIQKESINYIYN